MSKRNRTPAAAPETGPRITRSAAVSSPSGRDALYPYSVKFDVLTWDGKFQTPEAAAARSKTPAIKAEHVDAANNDWIESPKTANKKDWEFSRDGEFSSVTDNTTKKRKRQITQRECITETPIPPPGSQPVVQTSAVHHENATPSPRLPQPQRHKKRAPRQVAIVASTEVQSPELRTQTEAAERKARRKADKDGVAALPPPPASSLSSSTAQSAHPAPEASLHEKPPHQQLLTAQSLEAHQFAPTRAQIEAFLRANPAFMLSQDQQLLTPEHSQESVKMMDEDDSSETEDEPEAKCFKVEARDEIDEAGDIYDCSDTEETVSARRAKSRAQSRETFPDSDEDSSDPDDDSSSNYSVCSEDVEVVESEEESTYFSHRVANQQGIAYRPRTITPIQGAGPSSRLKVVIHQKTIPAANPLQASRASKREESSSDDDSDSDDESDRDPTPFSSSEASAEPERAENHYEELLNHIPDENDDYQPLRDPSKTPYIDEEPPLDVAPLSDAQLEKREKERQAARHVPAPLSSPSTVRTTPLLGPGHFMERRVVSRCETESLPTPPTPVPPPTFTAVNRQPAVTAKPVAKATQPESEHDSSSDSSSSEESDEDSETDESDDDSVSQRRSPPMPVRKTIPEAIKPAQVALPAPKSAQVPARMTVLKATKPAPMSTPAPKSAKRQAPSAPRRSSGKKAKVAEERSVARKLFDNSESNDIRSTSTSDALNEPSSQTSVEEMPSSPPAKLPQRPKHNAVDKAIAIGAQNAGRLSSLEIGPPTETLTSTTQRSPKGKGVDTAIHPNHPSAQPAIQELPSRKSSIQSEACNNFLQKKFGHPLQMEKESAATEEQQEGEKSKSKRKRGRSKAKSMPPTSNAGTEDATVSFPVPQLAAQETPASVPAPAQVSIQTIAAPAANSARVASGPQTQPTTAQNQQGRRGDRGRNNRNRNANANSDLAAIAQLDARDANRLAQFNNTARAIASARPQPAPRQSADEIAILNGFPNAAEEADYHDETWQEMKRGFKGMVEFFEDRVLLPCHVAWYKKRAGMISGLVEDNGKKGVRHHYGVEKSRRR